MGRLRLDIVNDKKVRVLQVTEKVDNGAYALGTGKQLSFIQKNEFFQKRLGSEH